MTSPDKKQSDANNVVPVEEKQKNGSDVDNEQVDSFL
jgi:hypothetical protein